MIQLGIVYKSADQTCPAAARTAVIGHHWHEPRADRSFPPPPAEPGSRQHRDETLQQV